MWLNENFLIPVQILSKWKSNMINILCGCQCVALLFLMRLRLCMIRYLLWNHKWNFLPFCRLTFSSELLNCIADSFVITLTGFASSYTQGVIRVRKRVTLMAVTVTVMSGVCWVSGIIVHSVYYFTSLSTIKETYSVTHTLLLLNTAVHPFVYALINRTFREKIKEMIWCSCTISTGSFSPPAVVPQHAATKQQSVSRMLSGPIKWQSFFLLIGIKHVLLQSLRNILQL